ncbi:MAG: hypothetical protein JRI96_15265 [Deltaproteobacteria bacterium]|nr:hypothetical protein [Deltaproteobacteria bacterium]
MKKIQCITFPRSGHHLLVNCLARYFGEDLLFDSRSIESGKDRSHFSAGELVYCEYYHHCGQTPCADPKTNFQKNHDFGLKLENNLSYNYIIQYRHPIESIVSYYKFQTEYSHTIENNKQNWMSFFKKSMVYWAGFTHKWIIKNKNPQTYYLLYFDLVNNPGVKLKEVIGFIRPSKKVNVKRLSTVVDKTGLRTSCKIKEFRFYDPRFFKEMERKVYKELELLSIKSIF